MPVHNKPRSTSSRLTHSHRTSSGGSSKVGLNNLGLTQKEGSQPKQQQQNLKRAGHSATDLHQGRQHPRAGHSTSNSRVRSKDQIVVAQRRSHSNKARQLQAAQTEQHQQHRQPQRPNFSIARSDDTSTDSDDEWVSSESGAVTPQINAYQDNNQHQQDGEGDLRVYGHGTESTLVDQQRDTKMNGNNIYGNADRATLTVRNGQDDVTTPRAEVELDLPRVETARPADIIASASSSSRAPSQHQQQGQGQPQEMKKAEPPPVVRVQPQSTPVTPSPPVPQSTSQQRVNEVDITPARQARSEAPSPTQLRQKAAAAAAAGSRRSALMRHSSTHTSHGDKKREMPPHPLIRGQSYHGAAGGSTLRPAIARLAPLTVNSEVAKAQLTASPSSAVTPGRADSPSFSYSYTKTPSDASTENQDRFPSRRGSISSLHSIATLPAPASGRFARAGKPQDQHYPYQNRTRTLSTLSTSSSSAALAALSTLPSISRPSSPPLTVRFPSDRRDRDPHDGIHTLLPPTYFSTHMPVLTKFNPLNDCWERTTRAKRVQGR